MLLKSFILDKLQSAYSNLAFEDKSYKGKKKKKSCQFLGGEPICVWAPTTILHKTLVLSNTGVKVVKYIKLFKN